MDTKMEGVNGNANLMTPAERTVMDQAAAGDSLAAEKRYSEAAQNYKAAAEKLETTDPRRAADYYQKVSEMLIKANTKVEEPVQGGIRPISPNPRRVM